MNYLKIEKENMNNGSGLRVVLWLSGCSHQCKGCQNPQTWNPDSGIPFNKSAKEELLRELNNDYISGITLTGGDPLYEGNLDDVLDLLDEIRLSSHEKTIWLYTGYMWESIMSHNFRKLRKFFLTTSDECENAILKQEKRQQIISQCDVLVDGRYIDSLRDITLPYRGSSNQRIIDIQKSLQKGEVVLWDIRNTK